MLLGTEDNVDNGNMKMTQRTNLLRLVGARSTRLRLVFAKEVENLTILFFSLVVF